MVSARFLDQRHALARHALGISQQEALNYFARVRKDALRLLLVDDEEAARYGMRRALSTFGYQISEADSAEAARILLKQQEPDLLLLDVNLPGISGLDFLRELQSSDMSEPPASAGGPSERSWSTARSSSGASSF